MLKPKSADLGLIVPQQIASDVVGNHDVVFRNIVSSILIN